MESNQQRYAPLFAKLGFEPNDIDIFDLAFTHKSYNGYLGTKHIDYERLEFLGDSIVGMVVSELCYIYHPDYGQGSLSVLKAQFIRTASEADYCRRLGLDAYVRVGPSFGDSKGNLRLYEDVFESFLGAMLLDQGLEFTYRFLRKFLEEDVKKANITVDLNPKSRLQEAMQADTRRSVTYKLIEEKHIDKEKIFVMGVYFEDVEIGRGEGASKKIGEIKAAEDALAKLSIVPLPQGEGLE